jgi:uncharacterized membrane protein
MAEPSFVERLGREIESWVAEGLISPEKASALRARYETAERVSEPRGRAVAALATIGAIAVGIGVIGFLAANWDAMSHALRLALLTGAVGASYAGGYQLRERSGDHPRIGEALYLLGVILFGASLFLVGQMYNVQAHDPLALLIWAAAAVAMAVVVGSKAIAWAALLIFTGWVGFEAGTALEDSGDDATGLPVLALFYGGALSAAGSVAAERVRAIWFAETGFGSAARRLGLLLGSAGIFTFTFSEIDVEGAAQSLSRPVEVILLAVAGLALVGAVGLALGERRTGPAEGGLLAVSVALALAALYVGGDGTLYALLFNVVFAAVALGAIYAGYVGDEPWLVNVGVALVAIDLVARYFDVFWSALPRSVGMIGAGALVLAIAYVLERQRKHLLARMEA